MKVIETVYKGYRFRSRLEARWAVYFDAVGLKWLYEDEGYVLRDSTYYLPDFYLPQINSFVEVKPEVSTEGERKCMLLSEQHPEKTVIMVTGLPCDKLWPTYHAGYISDAVTLDYYPVGKGWSSPYQYGTYQEQSYQAFNAARAARFEYLNN